MSVRETLAAPAGGSREPRKTEKTPAACLRESREHATVSVEGVILPIGRTYTDTIRQRLEQHAGKAGHSVDSGKEM